MGPTLEVKWGFTVKGFWHRFGFAMNCFGGDKAEVNVDPELAVFWSFVKLLGLESIVWHILRDLGWRDTRVWLSVTAKWWGRVSCLEKSQEYGVKTLQGVDLTTSHWAGTSTFLK